MGRGHVGPNPDGSGSMGQPLTTAHLIYTERQEGKGEPRLSEESLDIRHSQKKEVEKQR